MVPPLRPGEIRELDALITDPVFELEAGRDDGMLRRVAARFGFRGGGSMEFELRLSNLNQPIEIDAPESGRPIRELLRRLGAGGRGDRRALPVPA
jgi:hypothetical protein